MIGKAITHRWFCQYFVSSPCIVLTVLLLSVAATSCSPTALGKLAIHWSTGEGLVLSPDTVPWFWDHSCDYQSSPGCRLHSHKFIIVCGYMAMSQYLLIPFLEGWTSIYQLFWCSPGVQGFNTLPFYYFFTRITWYGKHVKGPGDIRCSWLSWKIASKGVPFPLICPTKRPRRMSSQGLGTVRHAAHGCEHRGGLLHCHATDVDGPSSTAGQGRCGRTWLGRHCKLRWRLGESSIWKKGEKPHH